MIRYFALLLTICFALSADAQNVRVGSQTSGQTTLCQSAVLVSHTGNTTETALATCTIPANALGPNGRLKITAYFTATSSANNKTGRLRYSGIGGTAYGAGVLTTQTSMFYPNVEIANRNATNSQVGPQGGAAFTGTLSTSAADTTAATTLVITCQLALGTETCSLESYSVTLVPGA